MSTNAHSHESYLRASDLLHHQVTYPFKPKKLTQSLRLGTAAEVTSCLFGVPLTRDNNPDQLFVSIWDNQMHSNTPTKPPFVISLAGGSPSGHDLDYFKANFQRVVIGADGTILRLFNNTYGHEYAIHDGEGKRSKFHMEHALMMTHTIPFEELGQIHTFGQGVETPHKSMTLFYAVDDGGSVLQLDAMIGWYPDCRTSNQDIVGFRFSQDEMAGFVHQRKIPEKVDGVASCTKLLYGDPYTTNYDFRSQILVPDSAS